MAPIIYGKRDFESKFMTHYTALDLHWLSCALSITHELSYFSVGIFLQQASKVFY